MDERERDILKTACNRFRLKGRLDKRYGIADKNAYGNGVSVLLYGHPGTGKTMAARVISSELSLPLYKVDMSQMISKYIGETEKNLSIVFERAAKSNVILFFDEADALFTKRTEVSDANDKHANAQTAFLLQKIEEYQGITLLATNLYHNFDTAFIRRITYVARMDAPDAATRKRLWLNTLPKSVPMDEDIDFDFLAERFELSGANIKAILLSAAYLAGEKEEAVSVAHIIKAMRYEFVKLGKIIDPAEFGKYVMY
ncbi:MAG: ATP-binding protein, partial [Lachnospiraceae bacterium]|nr:ATP-binding protein [Lachnospiraceae bacterium]